MTTRNLAAPQPHQLGLVDDPTPADTGYRCLLLDPPWNEKGGSRGADKHYPLLATPDIPRVVMQSPLWLPADNAHLWLWVTSNFLEDGLFVMRALGFRYVSNAVARAAGVERIAETFRAPRSCSADDGLDFDLFASPVQQVTTPKASSIDRRKAGPHGRLPRRFEAPRGRHSQKPEESYRRIERVSPGPRAEIFAREKREGWDVWGNEVAD